MCGEGTWAEGNWLLLCDECPKAFHTQCLQPALLAVPEGEWLCPTCDTGENCEVCGVSTWIEGNELLLCDGCPKGWHAKCLRPPLDAVPEGEWKCPCCELHPHPLRRSTRRLNHCDVCGGVSTAWRCASGCDFDVCAGCFANVNGGSVGAHDRQACGSAQALAVAEAAVPPPPEAKPRLDKMNKAEARALQGKFIEVYWDGEAAWFEAEVLSPSKASRRCRRRSHLPSPSCPPQVRAYDQASRRHTVRYTADEYECEELLSGPAQPELPISVWRPCIKVRGACRPSDVLTASSSSLLPLPPPSPPLPPPSPPPAPPPRPY